MNCLNKNTPKAGPMGGKIIAQKVLRRRSLSSNRYTGTINIWTGSIRVATISQKRISLPLNSNLANAYAAGVAVTKTPIVTMDARNTLIKNDLPTFTPLPLNRIVLKFSNVTFLGIIFGGYTRSSEFGCSEEKNIHSIGKNQMNPKTSPTMLKISLSLLCLLKRNTA